MQFSTTAEDMHAARPPYDLDEVNGFEGEEPSDNQEFDSHDDDVEPMEDQWLDGYYESQTECDFGEWPTGAAKAASFLCLSPREFTYARRPGLGKTPKTTF